MSKVVILLIKLYQMTLRPCIGKNCRFYPSCSDYSIEALKKYGILKGSFLALKRIIKCGPWNLGGYDPLP